MVRMSWTMGHEPQEAQKVSPARPQRVKGRVVPSAYVEGLNDARTPLADFFGFLLERPEPNDGIFRCLP
jgi:hypothetical protein